MKLLDLRLTGEYNNSPVPRFSSWTETFIGKLAVTIIIQCRYAQHLHKNIGHMSVIIRLPGEKGSEEALALWLM